LRQLRDAAVGPAPIEGGVLEGSQTMNSIRTQVHGGPRSKASSVGWQPFGTYAFALILGLFTLMKKYFARHFARLQLRMEVVLP